MDQKFEFPKEAVELPSKGLVYPESSPLSKGVVEVRYMTAQHEDILTNQINNHREKSGLLLFTKGSYLLPALSLDDYISKHIPFLDEKLLLEDVIPSLNIENKKDNKNKI